ncbi:MAG: MFS transporter [Peptococcaceae bacterium]|nr:MFS transporter [Peptococcaceae bacterium]
MTNETTVLVPKEHSKIFLLAILLSGIVTMLNTSTVSISLPTYMSVFHVDINTVQWVVIGYMLPLGMAMPLSEYLCERYSYRRVFMLGVLGIGLCSLGCACSVNFFMLVAFRFLKGVCGGIVIPSTMAMLYRYIPKNKQSEYLGTSMLFQNLGVALGPTVSGLLLQVSSWHILFVFNIPLVAIILWAANKSIPAETMTEEVDKIDFFGSIQVSMGSGLIMIAFSMAESWGWTSLKFCGCLVVGIVLVVTFILRQFHTKHPLLNFSVLKFKPFALAFLVYCTIAITLGINAILSQFYFQNGRGLSPATVGLLLIAPSVAMLLGNLVTNYLHRRGLMKSLIIGGIGCALLGNLGLCALKMDSNLVFIMSCFAFRFFGISLAQMPLTNYGIGSVPRELSGHASTLFNWGRQLMQTISTNILTVLLSYHLTRYYLEMGNSGTPKQGSMDYRLSAIQAVNTDYIYLAIVLVVTLILTFFIETKKQPAKS